MRDRGVSAILIGHVPPARVDSKESWDETCWQKYALWERQYRDVIVGSLFGHMNIDHFMLQDFHHIKKGAKKGLMAANDFRSTVQSPDNGLLTDGEITLASASDYLVDLRWWWSKLPSPTSRKSKQQYLSEYVGDEEHEPLPIWQRVFSAFSKPQTGQAGGKGHSFLDKIGGPYAERYSVSLVAPSVVPNYFPTIRVFEYNITGLEGFTASPVLTRNVPKNSSLQQTSRNHAFSNDDSYLRTIKSLLRRKHRHHEQESLKQRKKYKFKVPNGPSKSAPPGPAYSPQTLTLTSYTQYFANLTQINNDFVTPSYSPDESSPRTIFGLEVVENGRVEQRGWKEGKHGKHQGKKPRGKPHPREFKFEVEYDTKTDERYRLRDLTVRSWVDLARRIGKGDEGREGRADAEAEEKKSEDSEGAGEVGAEGKKKKKRPSKNKTWLTFVDRAFVGTLDPSELDLFSGHMPVVKKADGRKTHDQDEVTEL